MSVGRWLTAQEFNVLYKKNISVKCEELFWIFKINHMVYLGDEAKGFDIQLQIRRDTINLWWSPFVMNKMMHNNVPNKFKNNFSFILDIYSFYRFIWDIITFELINYLFFHFRLTFPSKYIRKGFDLVKAHSYYFYRNEKKYEWSKLHQCIIISLKNYDAIIFHQ